MADPAELARICREAINQEIYGGDCPGDSTALSEAWPTAHGAAFTIDEHIVIIAPAAMVTDTRLWRADYEAGRHGDQP